MIASKEVHTKMKTNRKPLSPQWQDEEALKRFQIIAPLLDESLDDAKRIQLRRQQAEKHDLSEKTLLRYTKAYASQGFEGLKPKTRSYYQKPGLPDNYQELVREAIQLRREVPSRSVEKIILILEMEKKVAPGILKRSTLQKHLHDAGFGAEQMEIYREARSSSSKRYCKPHRMMLVQGDIKEGIYLPIGKNGRKVKTYLSSAIDDHSRMILSSKFYDNEEEKIVEDTMHEAILKYGKFDRAYFDNGSQYVAKQLKLSLAKLSIRISYAPVASGKSKGKIEKFHRIVSQFLDEAKAKKIQTLSELNRYWTIYLEEFYQNDPHEGIREYYESHGIELPKEGITPLQEFNRDIRPLTFLDTTLVNEAFLYHEERKVDKGACFRFQGRKYEAKASLIGCRVEISYDPNAPETVTVSYPGMEPFQSRPVSIESYCNLDDPLPRSMKAVEPETSRFLDALEKQHEEHKKHRADAISFGSYRREVDDSV